MSHFIHEHPFAKQTGSLSSGTATHSSGSIFNNPSGASVNSRSLNSTGAEDLTRIFNTALIATQMPENSNPAAELQGLMDSTAFRAILSAIRQIAKTDGISERQAAELVIRTFRKMDQIWSDYVYQEGVDRLRNQLGPR